MHIRHSLVAFVAAGSLLAAACASDDASSDDTDAPVPTEGASTTTGTDPTGTDVIDTDATGTTGTDDTDTTGTTETGTSGTGTSDTGAGSTTASSTTAPSTSSTDAPHGAEWVTHFGDPSDPSCQCADGSEHVFHSLDRDPDKVLLYFQGGGACFSPETCDFETGTYKVSTGEDDIATTGIFDWEHEGNPFADWSVVFVPYCSGDVFLGDAEHEYAPDLVVQHRGALHAQKGLDYLVATYPDAQEVFVTGSSAGGVPAPRYGGLAADALPDATVTVLADGSGGYPSREPVNSFIGALWGVENAFPDWPELADAAPGSVGIPDLFTITGQHAPNVALARFDHAADEVQQSFSALAGTGTTVLDVLDENEAATEAAGVRLDVYVAPGTDHTILGSPDVWTLETEGVSFLDWLRALIDSGAPGDVHCTECGTPAVEE